MCALKTADARTEEEDDDMLQEIRVLAARDGGHER